LSSQQHLSPPFRRARLQPSQSSHVVRTRDHNSRNIAPLASTNILSFYGTLPNVTRQIITIIRCFLFKRRMANITLSSFHDNSQMMTKSQKPAKYCIASPVPVYWTWKDDEIYRKILLLDLPVIIHISAKQKGASTAETSS
jgi:hypothetical protein